MISIIHQEHQHVQSDTALPASVCLCWPGASLFSHPHSNVQTQGLLSNLRAAYGAHTLSRAYAHTHLENLGTLKEEDNVLPLHPSIMLCDPPPQMGAENQHKQLPGGDSTQ